jgi:predicted nucleotidyltransferase
LVKIKKKRRAGHGKDNKYIVKFGGKTLKRRDDLGKLDVYSRITLKRI